MTPSLHTPPKPTPQTLSSPTFSTTLQTTLQRDFAVLLSRWQFWLALTVAAAISGFIYFSYLEDFLAIQPTLRAKSFQYGVTDLVIVPYLKTLGYVAVIILSALCSRLFYWEIFADFSHGFRSTPVHLAGLITAKLSAIALLSLLILTVIALPALGSGLAYDYNVVRICFLLLALFMLLLTVGTVAMVLSQFFSHGILVTLLTTLWVGLSELATTLITEPTWVLPIIQFFSPLTHTNRIAIGVVSFSDVVFWVLLLSGLIALSARQFRNTYLTVS